MIVIITRQNVLLVVDFLWESDKSDVVLERGWFVVRMNFFVVNVEILVGERLTLFPDVPLAQADPHLTHGGAVDAMGGGYHPSWRQKKSEQSIRNEYDNSINVGPGQKANESKVAPPYQSNSLDLLLISFIPTVTTSTRHAYRAGLSVKLSNVDGRFGRLP